MIIADSREPKELVELLRTVVPVEVATLHTGDFLIVDTDGCTIGIERKSISDFLSSFGSRRLRQQLTRLRRAYRPILLIEGFYTVDENLHVMLGRRSTGWFHLAIQMALFSIQGAGIRVLWTVDHRTTVDVLRGLHQRAETGCLVGLDEWGMEADDGGGPEGGPDDLRLAPVTNLVGSLPGRPPSRPSRRIVASAEPPSVSLRRA